MDVLLEREPELERIRAAVREARAGAGGLIVIGGPAGIGKTALMRAGAAIAEESGMRVLRARGSDLEQEFAFGVVRQLFEAPLAGAGEDDRRALLAGAAALAGPLFEPGGVRAAAVAERPDLGSLPDQPADRRFTLVHSLYWLTANLSSAGGPLALVVDDGHWADAPSLRFLAYLSARREQLGTLVVVAVRDGEPSGVQDLLVALRATPSAVLIEPRSLSEDAVATLVRDGLGSGADARFCTACARASAGNPFLVRELIAELETERIEPVAANVRLVEGVRLESVSRAVVARLNRLGADSRNLARAVAVLESASPREAAALAGLSGARARRAADRLISAQILAGSASLTFVHPLLRRAVYERIPAAALADGHRRAGLLLGAKRARSTRVGAHLMRGAPAGDPAVVALLRDAAREALANGAPQTAIHLLRRALDEPPRSTLRGLVVGELGEAEALARSPSAAEHLREALELVDDPQLRVRLVCALAEMLVWDGRIDEAHAVIVEALDGLGPDGPVSLRAVLETVRAHTALVHGRLGAEIEPRLPELRELAAAAGPAGRGLLVFVACWKASRGPYDSDWRELLKAGLDGGRLVTEEVCGPQMARHAAAALVFADEVEQARAQLADVRLDTISRGSINARLSGIMWSVLLALRQGDLGRAESLAREALELAERHQVAWAKVWLAAFLGEVLLERGAVGSADAVLAQAPAERASATAAAIRVLFMQGRVRLEQARSAEAAELLRAAGAGVIIDNPSYLPWRSTLALALVSSDGDEARALARRELELARWFGQPRGVGIALRASGVIHGGERGIELLRQAVAALRVSPARLELARALYGLGAVCRRAGQRTAAREPLREALGLAQACGAGLLERQIREDLSATGIRLRRDRVSGPDALTPAERRVAELAASGLTNREIAQTLFVTVKTVGTHLGHIYAKLDLAGAQAREQLGACLSGNGGASGDGALGGAGRGAPGDGAVGDAGGGAGRGAPGVGAVGGTAAGAPGDGAVGGTGAPDDGAGGGTAAGAPGVGAVGDADSHPPPPPAAHHLRAGPRHRRALDGAQRG